MSQKLIEKYQGLPGVINCDIAELMTNNGIGIAKATKIKAIQLITEVMVEVPKVKRIKIMTPYDAHQVSNFICNQAQEHLLILCLDNKSKLICKKVIYIGTIDEITIHPREIFNLAIKKLSSNIIIVHNHPSGDINPSVADIVATKKILEISLIIGITLIDHIIVSNDVFYSIRENCDIIF